MSGLWRSMAARVTGGHEVAGSNPASPTERTLALQGFFSLEGGARLAPGMVFLNVFWVQYRLASCGSLVGRGGVSGVPFGGWFVPDERSTEGGT